MGARLSPPGKARDPDAPENGRDGSFESSDSLLQSWNSQSSLLEQRVPSFESCEDECSQALGLSKPTMSFKDYIQERSDPVEQGKPVIPAAVLAGFTGEGVGGARSPSPPRPCPAPHGHVYPGCSWSELIASAPRACGPWGVTPTPGKLCLNSKEASLVGMLCAQPSGAVGGHGCPGHLGCAQPLGEEGTGARRRL